MMPFIRGGGPTGRDAAEMNQTSTIELSMNDLRIGCQSKDDATAPKRVAGAGLSWLNAIAAWTATTTDKTAAPKMPISWPIVAAVIICLIGTATGLLYQDYQSVSAAGQQRADSLAEIAAAHVQQTLSAIELSMRVQDHHTAAAMPALTRLQMIDETGRPVAGAAFSTASAQDFRESVAFIFHRDHPGDDILLARPDSTGVDLLISRRLTSADGHFAGIILGNMDVHYFDRFFAALGAVAVELALPDGTILVQFPPYISVAVANDGQQFVANRMLDGMPLVISIGLDRQAFLASWESKRNVAVALVCALIVLFVGGIAAMRKHTATAVAMVAMETRNRAEATARHHADELSRRKSDFLSQMSHELRTPLNAIIGFSEVIKEESFGPVGQPKYQEYADDIHYSAQHLLSVINNILDLSKVEAGKWHMAEDEVTLDDLFDALLRLATERASRENVRLSIKSAPPGTIIRGDKRTLLQIMLNLTINAIKFAGPDRVVDLDVRPGLDGGISISVADHGDGMTQDELEKAMKPFDSPASHLNRKKQDTGLGLPLAAAFAELHGGRVELDSAPGVGTTAKLLLPASRVRLAL